MAHFVDKIQANNNPENLRVLLSQSHSPQDRAAAANCVHMIACPTQVIAATADRISDVEEERLLASAIDNSSFVEISEAGHLSPFEQPNLWRSHVLGFMDRDILQCTVFTNS